nr:restriction endonuclease subunit S [Mycoplasma miroungirhinis]
MDSTFNELSKTTLENLNINLPNLTHKQHIVNTIGSVDDLIENYQERITKMHELSDMIVSKIDKWVSYDYVRFDKGKEVGSSFYKQVKSKDDIEYIRVGDLINKNNTIYVSKNDKLSLCDETDILISFDGAPGRVATALNGYFSSGIRKVKSTIDDKGYIYFSLKNRINQEIIKKHSTGTTILHASNAINYLIFPLLSNLEKNNLNIMYFNIIDLEKKKQNLLNIKKTLLQKFFSINQ